jgi:hypothetical protein
MKGGKGIRQICEREGKLSVRERERERERERKRESWARDGVDRWGKQWSADLREKWVAGPTKSLAGTVSVGKDGDGSGTLFVWGRRSAGSGTPFVRDDGPLGHGMTVYWVAVSLGTTI